MIKKGVFVSLLTTVSWGVEGSHIYADSQLQENGIVEVLGDSSNKEIPSTLPLIPAQPVASISVSTCAPDQSTVSSPCYASISADFLYFKAVEDSLAYALRTPSAWVSGRFSGSFVEPDWDYFPAVRAALAITTATCWDIAAYWTYVYSSRSTSASSDSYDLYTIMTQATPALSGNAFVNHVAGKWKLNFNVAELLLEGSICLTKNFSLQPAFGIAGAMIRQNVNVRYEDYLIVSPAVSPQHVTGKNATWGVGPKIALGMVFFMPRDFSFDFLAGFASLLGKSDAKTKYSQFLKSQALVTSPNDFLEFTEDSNRLFSMMQIQASLEKRWGCDGDGFSLMLGWETQVWFRQMRLNYFGTIDAVSTGADLTLQGPFIRASLLF
jgi:hypothetical protein